MPRSPSYDIQEDDLDSIFLAHSPRFRQLLDEAYQRYLAGKSLSKEEFWEQVRRKRAKAGTEA